MAFLPRSSHLLISWLQSPSPVLYLQPPRHPESWGCLPWKEAGLAVGAPQGLWLELRLWVSAHTHSMPAVMSSCYYFTTKLSKDPTALEAHPEKCPWAVAKDQRGRACRRKDGDLWLRGQPGVSAGRGARKSGPSPWGLRLLWPCEWCVSCLPFRERGEWHRLAAC